jgi:hypothetical protein
MTSYVDAQNAFGATIRTGFICKAKGTGPDASKYLLLSLEMD